MHKTGAEFFPLGLNQRDFSVIFPSKKKKKERKGEREQKLQVKYLGILGSYTLVRNQDH